MADKKKSNLEYSKTSDLVGAAKRSAQLQLSPSGSDKQDGVRGAMQRSATGQSTGKAPLTKKDMSRPMTLKKGGKVKKTGLALVHKGEKMLTAKQVKKKKR
jgi:hypothetical protein